MTSKKNLTRLNLQSAMNALSWQTKNAYTRWIVRYLAETYQIDKTKFDLEDIRIDVLVAALKPEHFQHWLEILQKKGLSAASLMQARCAVVWAAGELAAQKHTTYVTQGALKSVPTPDVPENARNKNWLTPKQLQNLVQTAVQTDQSEAIKARNAAILTLMIDHGLRREEIVAARWIDLSNDNEGRNFLLVRGKGNKRRLLELTENTKVAIEKWQRFHPNPRGDHPIFTAITTSGNVSADGLTGQGILLVVKEAGHRAGIENISPHDLRRSFARNAYQSGLDYEALRQTLGHESAGTTQIYLGNEPKKDPT